MVQPLLHANTDFKVSQDNIINLQQRQVLMGQIISERQGEWGSKREIKSSRKAK